VCYGDQMCKCLVPYYSLYDFQREGSAENGEYLVTLLLLLQISYHIHAQLALKRRSRMI
jgi:hypothetical protein